MPINKYMMTEVAIGCYDFVDFFLVYLLYGSMKVLNEVLNIKNTGLFC